MENIDNTDKAILRALQENAKLTTKELVHQEVRSFGGLSQGGQ